MNSHSSNISRQETQVNNNNNNSHQYDDNYDNDNEIKQDKSINTTQNYSASSKGSEFTSNWDAVVESFDHLDLNKDLLRGIYSYGWEKPSKIQQRAIIPVIKGHDTIAQAQSGKGNNGTFCIAT
eukprot:115206_1